MLCVIMLPENFHPYHWCFRWTTTEYKYAIVNLIYNKFVQIVFKCKIHCKHSCSLSLIICRYVLHIIYLLLLIMWSKNMFTALILLCVFQFALWFQNCIHFNAFPKLWQINWLFSKVYVLFYQRNNTLQSFLFQAGLTKIFQIK